MKAAVLVVALAAGCATTVADATFIPEPGSPVLQRRPDGCHVEVFEEGKSVTLPHRSIGRVSLQKGKGDLRGGPDSGYASLRAVACEHGAFIVKEVRALPTADGFLFEGELAVLVDAEGKPVGQAPTDAGS